MSKTSIDLIDLPKYILIILYIITGSLSNFGAIDILAPQWIYLASINLLSCTYVLFFSKDLYYGSITKLFKTSYIYIYIFYIIWNAFSYFYAVNQSETLINLPRLSNTFFAIVFCYLLISRISAKLYFITSVFFLFLLAEMISYYYDFSIVYPKEGLRVIEIKGFEVNKNITAASIAFKIPFAIYLLIKSKRTISKVIIFVTLFAGVSAISLIEARAAILSTIIVFVMVNMFIIYQFIAKKISSNQFAYRIILVILPYLLAFFTNIVITSNTSDKYRKVAITETLGKISFTEESSNGRFNYWGDAFSYIKENPIIASGLGNWKIESIDKGKEHISGYTVPYHAHNDFIHVFSETGIFGGFAYLSLFILITFYIFKLNKEAFISNGFFKLDHFVLSLPLIVYGIDALLNFPVARPLMQSSLAIFSGLILSLHTKSFDPKINHEKQSTLSKIFLVLIFILLIPGLVVHIISFKSLTQQGRLLYEFNNANYTYTREELDQISHDFPNLTETAMPIKAMKARYYYLAGNKEEAHEMALKGIKDNPKIHFGDNLKSVFFLEENKIDSSYYYAKKAFDGLPNNMPHYDMYMRTLAFKRDAAAINEAFNKVHKLAGDTKGIWTIYLRTLALTRSLGDPFSMAKAQEAFKLYPTDENIFQLYRILTYGQAKIAAADKFAADAKELFEKGNFSGAVDLYSKAFDSDPLQYNHSLNAALTYYKINDFKKAIKFLSLSKSSKNPAVVEKALRFSALSHEKIGDLKKACANFIQLLNKFPKRMYQQEFNKYCR